MRVHEFIPSNEPDPRRGVLPGIEWLTSWTATLYVKNLVFYTEISRSALAHGSPVFSRNSRVLVHCG